VAFLRRCYTCQVSSVAARYRRHGSGIVPPFRDTVDTVKKLFKVMNHGAVCPAIFRSSLVILILSALAIGGYKARPWTIGAAESYPARLHSEGVTIAVQPLFQDSLAARVFDKSDIVTRGIMPVALLIFNDNDFPVQVDGASAELIHEEDRLRTLEPGQVVHGLFSKDKRNVWVPQPVPRLPGGGRSDAEALDDFEHKFFDRKIAEPHNKAGGFLYLRLPQSKDIRGYLAESRIYIPEISRVDTGAPMIYFEIDLRPAVDAVP